MEARRQLAQILRDIEEKTEAPTATATPPCYLCQVEDANETPFDPDQHRLCLICARKLEVMAEVGIAWDNEPQGKSYLLEAVDAPSPGVVWEIWNDEDLEGG